MGRNPVFGASQSGPGPMRSLPSSGRKSIRVIGNRPVFGFAFSWSGVFCLVPVAHQGQQAGAKHLPQDRGSGAAEKDGDGPGTSPQGQLNLDYRMLTYVQITVALPHHASTSLFGSPFLEMLHLGFESGGSGFRGPGGNKSRSSSRNDFSLWKRSFRQRSCRSGWFTEWDEWRKNSSERCAPAHFHLAKTRLKLVRWLRRFSFLRWLQVLIFLSRSCSLRLWHLV